MAQPALEHQEPVNIDLPIRNSNRTVGAMLSGQVAKRYGEAGLPPETIKIHFDGSAGQSFGAFLAKGIHIHLNGDTNDYRVIHSPPLNEARYSTILLSSAAVTLS